MLRRLADLIPHGQPKVRSPIAFCGGLFQYRAMRIWIFTLIAAAWIGTSPAGAEPGAHYFRAVASANTELGLPDGNGIPVQADVPDGTLISFRLEWRPDLAGTGAWSVVAMASASNAPGRVDYVLPVARPADVRWSDSFGNATWTQTWQVLSDKDWGWADLARTEEPGGRFETFLRASYPSNSCSPTATADYGTPEGGGQFLAVAGLAPTNALHLRYYVRFSEGFDFVKGGKLPGLFGGTNHFSGGAIPDGTNGFSTRYMWRTNGDGEAYAYLPTSTLYGTEIGRGRWRFQPGQWHCLEQRVVLNAPGIDDGRLTVWVDGSMLVDERTLRYRTTDSLQIRGIFFSTFFGGGDPTWATPRDVHADFAAFVLSPAYIGP